MSLQIPQTIRMVTRTPSEAINRGVAVNRADCVDSSARPWRSSLYHESGAQDNTVLCLSRYAARRHATLNALAREPAAEESVRLFRSEQLIIEFGKNCIHGFERLQARGVDFASVEARQ